MILLDSSLIVAYMNEADGNHARALRVVEEIEGGKHGSSVLTDYVFDEVVTVMLFKTRSLGRVVELGETLLGANLLFRIDEDVFNLSWKIFKEQQEPSFSFTDCASIAVCRTNGISNIATFDEDFQKVKELNVVGL